MQAPPVQIVRPSPASETSPAAARVPLVLAVGLGIVAALLVAASLLWVSYGTAVFFEMIASGIAACF